VNIGTGGPPSDGLKIRRTRWPSLRPGAGTAPRMPPCSWGVSTKSVLHWASVGRWAVRRRP